MTESGASQGRATPQAVPYSLLENAQVSITGPESIAVEFSIQDLVRRLLPSEPVDSCGGCNGCTGCSM